jgi:hypothetical protein
MLSYKQSFDLSITDDLKGRFSHEISMLEQLGFRFFGVHEEVIWPFSVVLFFPIYLIMAANEYTRIVSPLRIASYHIMYLSNNGSTFAYIYGLGVKFYTRFTNGVWLVTNTSQKLDDPKVLIQPAEPGFTSPEMLWAIHQEKVRELQARGLQLVPKQSFADWVGIESRFDGSNTSSALFMGFFWLAFATGMIFWIVKSIIGLFARG